MQEQVQEERRGAKKAAKKVAESAAEPKGAKAKQGAALKKEMDMLLDEIEDVLVENAESFVAQFIQKSGE